MCFHWMSLKFGTFPGIAPREQGRPGSALPQTSWPEQLDDSRKCAAQAARRNSLTDGNTA